MANGDDGLKRQLDRHTRVWDPPGPQGTPIGVPDSLDEGALHQLAPAGTPVVVIEAAADPLTLLDRARQVDGIRFPRFDRLRQYPATGQPQDLFRWLTGFFRRDVLQDRVLVFSAVVGLAGALMQGSEDHLPVWATGVALVGVIVPLFMVVPLIGASWRYWQ